MSIPHGLLPSILFNMFNIPPSRQLSSKCKGLIRDVNPYLQTSILLAGQTILQAKAFSAKMSQFWQCYKSVQLLIKYTQESSFGGEEKQDHQTFVLSRNQVNNAEQIPTTSTGTKKKQNQTIWVSG